MTYKIPKDTDDRRKSFKIGVNINHRNLWAFLIRVEKKDIFDQIADFDIETKNLINNFQKKLFLIAKSQKT